MLRTEHRQPTHEFVHTVMHDRMPLTASSNACAVLPLCRHSSMHGPHAHALTPSNTHKHTLHKTLPKPRTFLPQGNAIHDPVACCFPCCCAGFVLITIAWEYGIALMSFLSHLASGRRALWISRLKDEVLALGVVTLVLIALQVCQRLAGMECDAWV